LLTWSRRGKRRTADDAAHAGRGGGAPESERRPRPVVGCGRALVHRGGHHGRTRRRGGGARAAEVARWRCSRGEGGDGEVLARRRRRRGGARAAEAAAGRGGEARVSCLSLTPSSRRCLLIEMLVRNRRGEGLGFLAWVFVSGSFPLLAGEFYYLPFCLAFYHLPFFTLF
jgi:hypothetical protein